MITSPLELLRKFGNKQDRDVTELRGFMLPVEPIPHTRYRVAICHIAELHLRRRQAQRGGGVLLTGKSGAGKSTVLFAYSASFPRDPQQSTTKIPVLVVTVPSSPTARSLVAAILEAMGYKKTTRGNTAELTKTLAGLFEKCEVEMLLLDEFQHLIHAPTLNAFRDVTDWLKNLLERTKVGMVACGLSEAEAVIESNEQLARRFSERIRIDPFRREDPQDLIEFRGLLKTFGRKLPIPCEPPIHDSNVARRIYIASYGLIAIVVKLLEGAVAVADEIGAEQIDADVLAAAFRNRIWRDVPDKLNPFHPESPLRPLDRAGEVFYLHTRSDLIGSPVARKLGLNMTRGPE